MALEKIYPKNPILTVQLEMIERIQGSKGSISSRNLKAYFIRPENSVFFILISGFLKSLPVPEKEGKQTSDYEDAIKLYISKLNLAYIERVLKEVRKESLRSAAEVLYFNKQVKNFDEKELYTDKMIPYIDFKRKVLEPILKPPKQVHRHETVDFMHELIYLFFSRESPRSFEKYAEETAKMNESKQKV